MTFFWLGCIQSAFRDAKLGLGEYEVRVPTNSYSVTLIYTIIILRYFG